MIKTICDYCGKEINRKPSRIKRYKHHFCSKECQDKWQKTIKGEKHKDWNRIKIKCSYCGGNIYRAPSRIKAYIRQFCNMDCMSKWKKENQFGDKNPNWNSKSTLCEYCGKKIFVKKSLRCKVKHHFCGASCFYNWKKENTPVGKNHPNWKSIEKKCDFCGEKIFVAPRFLKKCKLHFCNKACFDDWERANKPRGKDSPVWNSKQTICKNCGKEMFVSPSKLELVKNSFCSKNCHNIWQKTKGPHGKNHPQWKQKIVICDFCGKKISRAPAFINDHNFCNRSCFSRWKKENTPKGRDNLFWKEKIAVHCGYCDKLLHIKPSLVKEKENHFCNSQG